MGSMAVAQMPSGLRYQFSQSLSSRQPQMTTPGNAPKFLRLSGIVSSTHIHDAGKCLSRKKQFFHDREIRHLSWSTQATGSGVEASFTEPNKNDISLRDVKTVVESRDDDKIQVRVDLTGEETQRTFDEVLTNLARTAPPIPGFRKMKGGKTSNVPRSFLLQMLGRDRVTKFVIQEIVSTTIRDYVTKENLKVGSNTCNTIQSAEELEAAFSPGATFGFNAVLEFESEPESSDPGSSE